MADETVNASWLQSKVAAQAKANDAMHSTVVRQRFVLNVLEELGRGLTREEWEKFRELRNDQARKRIGDYPEK